MTIILVAMILAAAQPERRDPLFIPSPEAVRTMHEGTGCLVRERAGEVRAVLAMDFRTRAYRDRLRLLARSTDRCFNRYFASSGLTFAGGLAEHLFLRDSRNVDSPHIAALPLPEARNRIEAMSFCIVRSAPAEALEVLETTAASEDEAAALDALRPAIAQCLHGADEAQFNRPGLRALVALALYNLARTAPGEGS